MYCTRCGSRNDDSSKFCAHCGAALETRAASAEAPAQSRPAAAAMPMEASRGSTILTLGILSVVLLGLIAGIPAWVMGHGDLQKMKAGRMNPDQRGMTQAGMVLGIIGTFHVVLAMIVVLAVVSGLFFAVVAH